MNLKPWNEVAVPHEDVLKGTFQQAEFAADLSRVHAGTATSEYQDPVLFFGRTFITEGMRLLLDSVVKRLTGKGGDPVIQLQTAFGGGKTHTMLAVYHLAKGTRPASDLQGIAPILDAAGIADLPKARVVVLDGNQLAPNQPRKQGKLAIRTMWGELAFQLGGEEAYQLVNEADASGTSPGKTVLASLLTQYAPCVILVDELVAYFRQFEDGKPVSGGTYDSNLSFIQALTEALKAVPTAVLLASLPMSEREAGSHRGVSALKALEHYFGRVQALWKPVASEEAFEIVRRRLFASINDRLAAETVCRTYADYYVANSEDLPRETQESRYYDRLQRAYPIHPEVFDRLYEDWSSLDNFQRTRGVLKLMAKVIHRLWKEGNNDPLIMPANLPLYDADIRNEAIYYLPAGWDPVLERDIDGEHAETSEIESRDPRFGAIQACRRISRTIFLGSAPSAANEGARGIELERILLGTVKPGQQLAVYKDALRRLVERLHYLNSSNNRFWFDTRPNLRREMEDRKRRFQDREDVVPMIRDRVQRSLTSGVFGGVHVFTSPGDVPDDWYLRLVVLPPDAGFNRTTSAQATERAAEFLATRGEQPRFKKNRLIFLAADSDSLGRLKDQVRSVLAWQSIVDDIRDMKLLLNQHQSKQATKTLEEAHDALRRMVRETFKWLLVPMQEAKAGKGLSEVQWEPFALNPGAQNFTQEIESVLKVNELVIFEWAPIHLRNLLNSWFWKDGVPEANALQVWQQTCQQLYLPRLKDDHVFQNAIAAGMDSRDFFGSAQAKDDATYIGFTFARPTSVILDTALLLVEPGVAATYAAARSADAVPQSYTPDSPTITPLGPRGGVLEGSKTDQPITLAATAKSKVFYGSVEIDPIQAKIKFADLVDEVVQQFTSKPGVKVTISVEISATASDGFDDQTRRAVKENCNVLRFKNAEFEPGE